MGVKLADIQKIDVAPAATPTPLRGLALGADGTVPASVLPAKVTGIIPAAGAIQTSGTGFTYTHTNATGIYVITFSPAFDAQPVIVCGSNEAALLFFQLSAISAAGFTVTITNSAGTTGDHAFNFAALAAA